jgi:hypothetical protein
MPASSCGAAALLHDIGHYPYSHALEEIGALHHEEVARPLVTTGEVADVLRSALGDDAPDRIMALIRGRSGSPLQGLISGSLDLDKIEYLKRDAFMCGVNYGDIDVDRLLHSLTVVADPERGDRMVGVYEKGLSALESLLFAKYQMYRNVYWHHAVRSATAMYKRLVDGALRAGSLSAETLASFTDEGLLHELERRAPSPLLAALRERRLYKRVFECPAAELPPEGGEWIADDRALVVAWRTASPANSGSRRASCSSTTRRRHRCSVSTSPCFAAMAAYVVSPRKAGRARSTSRSCRRSSTAARAGCASSPVARWPYHARQSRVSRRFPPPRFVCGSRRVDARAVDAASRRRALADPGPPDPPDPRISPSPGSFARPCASASLRPIAR